MSDRAKRAFTGNIKSSIFGTPAERRQSVLIATRDLYRTFHKRLAAEGHDLHCQIEDGLDQRPITEGHADGYDAIVSWLAGQIVQLHEEIATN